MLRGWLLLFVFGSCVGLQAPRGGSPGLFNPGGEDDAMVDVPVADVVLPMFLVPAEEACGLEGLFALPGENLSIVNLYSALREVLRLESSSIIRADVREVLVDKRYDLFMSDLMYRPYERVVPTFPEGLWKNPLMALILDGRGSKNLIGDLVEYVKELVGHKHDGASNFSTFSLAVKQGRWLAARGNVQALVDQLDERLVAIDWSGFEFGDCSSVAKLLNNRVMIG